MREGSGSDSKKKLCRHATSTQWRFAGEWCYHVAVMTDGVETESLLGKTVYSPARDAFLKVLKVQNETEAIAHFIGQNDKGFFPVSEREYSELEPASEIFPDDLAADYNELRRNGGDAREAGQIRGLFQRMNWSCAYQTDPEEYNEQIRVAIERYLNSKT